MNNKDKIRIAEIARHIMGKTSTFRSVRTVDISTAKLRELCAELYCHIDSIVEVLDRVEKKE